MKLERRPSVLFALLSLVLILAKGAGEAEAQSTRPLNPRRSPPTNTHGAPVLDPQGRRIEYDRVQMAGQAARSSAGRIPGTGGTAAAPESTPGAQASVGLTPVWHFVDLGHAIGDSNIIVSNGVIYAGASPSLPYWYALRRDAATSSYQQVFASRYYPAPVNRIVLADVLGDSRKEIVVALNDGQIVFHDEITRQELGSIQTSCTYLKGLAVADWDGDSTKELILTRSGHLYVYDPSGQLEWDLSGVSGNDVVVGQMDADPGMELALTDGNVIDAATRTIQWNWPSGFGFDLDLCDFDADGMQELIAAETWSFIWSFDVDTQLPKWSLPTSNTAAIRVGDVDGDQVNELLVGEAQWGDVLAYDLVTLQQLWAIPNPDHGVTDVGFGDVDQDGVAEIIWGAGATSSGEDHLHVGDWLSQSVEWTSTDLDGPFVGPLRGDVDGDGIQEYVLASAQSDSGYGSGRILVFDGSNLKLRAISPEIVNGRSFTGLRELRLRDVDQDGALDILVAADELYDGAIEVYGFDVSNQFTLKWSNASQPFGAPFASVDALDVDGDGQLEIVAGGSREHTGALGVFIYVYDYSSGNEEWHSLQMGAYWNAIAGLALDDVDADGRTETLGQVEGGDIYVFDGVTKTLEAILTGPFLSLQTQAVGATTYIVSGDSAGGLHGFAWNGSGYAPIGSLSLGVGAVDGFTFGPLLSLWVGAGGRLTLFVPWFPGIVWQSGPYGEGHGNRTVFGNIGVMSGFMTAGRYCAEFFLLG